jgi:hypothetical protein
MSTAVVAIELLSASAARLLPESWGQLVPRVCSGGEGNLANLKTRAPCSIRPPGLSPNK